MLNGTEHKQLGKQLREVRSASNNAAEQARERSEKLGLLAAKTYGKRMVRTFRDAEEAKRDSAALDIQRIARGWRARSSYATELPEYRKMLLSAKTSGLVGPRSSQQQHLLFKLQYLEKEIVRVESRKQHCPDGNCLGDLRTQDPDDILLAWVNHHLERAGCARRLQDWTVDLYDSEILAIFCIIVGGFFRIPKLSSSASSSSIGKSCT